MKIGIISDTHDNISNINKALELFKKIGINFFIHAGDYVAPFSLKPYFDQNFDFVGVFGNNDGEKNGLLQKSKGKIKEPPYAFSILEKQIVVVHDILQFRDFRFDIKPHIVISGHTHNPQIKQEDGILFINPGEACGWLTAKATVAVLDLETMKAEIVELR